MLSKDSDQESGLRIPPTQWYQSLDAAAVHNPEVLGAARYWLQVEGSFTRALKQKCLQSFHVDVVHEGYGHPDPEEIQTLGLAPGQQAWIREVRLCGDGRPWVLARTVIPPRCFEGKGEQLRHLGNRPLGAYLFSSSHWRRGPLETGLCRPEHPDQPRLARRSLFHHHDSALIVGEYLLPILYSPPEL